MELTEFIKHFADQFDNTDISEFKPSTNFRELDEWSSLTLLAVLDTIDRKFNVIIKDNEITETKTIQELFDLVQSKSN